MRTVVAHPFLAAALFALAGVACSGGGIDEAEPLATEELAVRPGHGNASIPGQDLMDGDRTNPFDSTDDPTDPSFVPEPSPLLPQPTSELSTTRQPLSTSYGTSFDLTYYWIAMRPSTDPNEVVIRDCSGSFLTYASRTFRDQAIMEGTARFKTSSGETKTINAGDGCWISLPYSQRWGLGVTNPATGNSFNLRPFRSIAVDRNVLTIGRWYYVKELDGVQMPYPASTTTHNGCVRAVDVGPAINGKHIDFYVGYKSAYSKLINGSSTMGGRTRVTMYEGTYKCKTHIERGY